METIKAFLTIIGTYAIAALLSWIVGSTVIHVGIDLITIDSYILNEQLQSMLVGAIYLMPIFVGVAIGGFAAHIRNALN